MNITVATSELKSILEKNLVTHDNDYEEAKVAYQKACITELESMLSEVRKTGKLKRTVIKAPKPVRYSKEYRMAIRMLELHQQESITLPPKEYTQFVEDQWQWSRDFTANTLSYKNG
jgi:hypothetical protein